MADDQTQPIVGTGEAPLETQPEAVAPISREEARLALSGMLDESSIDVPIAKHSPEPLSSPLHLQAERELAQDSLPSYKPSAPPTPAQPVLAPRPTPPPQREAPKPFVAPQKNIPSQAPLPPAQQKPLAQKPPLRTIPIAPAFQKATPTSLADIALSQESARRAYVDAPEKKSSGWGRTLFVGGAIFVFLIGGAIALYTAFSNKNPKPIITVEKPLKKFLLSPDVTYALSFASDKTANKKIISDALAKENKTDGAIGAFYISGKNSAGKEVELSAADTLITLNAKIPSSFMQSLGADYMTGRFAGATGNSLFFVLTITSYEDVFGGLQDWFTEDALTFAQTLKNTDVLTTDGLTWKNVFIKNIDARILTNDDDEILLAYTFLTRNRLLITADKESFIALTERYATPQKPTP